MIDIERRDVLIGDVVESLQEHYPQLNNTDFRWGLMTYLTKRYKDTGNRAKDFLTLQGKAEKHIMKTPAPDCGKEGGDPHTPGTRIWNTTQSEFGVSQGQCGMYYGEAGLSSRIRVLWKNGKKTNCCCKGIWMKKGKWTIQ
jgi:hypothetical protein